MKVLTMTLCLALCATSVFAMGAAPPTDYWEQTEGIESRDRDRINASGAYQQPMTPQMQAIITQAPGALGPYWDENGNPIPH